MRGVPTSDYVIEIARVSVTTASYFAKFRTSNRPVGPKFALPEFSRVRKVPPTGRWRQNSGVPVARVRGGRNLAGPKLG